MPQLGLMLCHMGMSMTDVTITGLISPAAQASLGVVGQVFTLLMLVASLVGSGCLAAVSQALGMGLARRAARYAALIVVLALFVGGQLADGAMRAGAAAHAATDEHYRANAACGWLFCHGLLLSVAVLLCPDHD